jgi:hypothetical protein
LETEAFSFTTIFNRSRNEQRAGNSVENSADVAVQIIADAIGNRALAILCREDEVDQDFGKGLRPDGRNAYGFARSGLENGAWITQPAGLGYYRAALWACKP